MTDTTVRVSYLELTRQPAPIPVHVGDEHISREHPSVSEYLDLYGRIGEPLHWDQRFKMPRAELLRLLESERSAIYLLRDSGGQALGLCEFERGTDTWDHRAAMHVYASAGFEVYRVREEPPGDL